MFVSDKGAVFINIFLPFKITSYMLVYLECYACMICCINSPQFVTTWHLVKFSITIMLEYLFGTLRTQAPKFSSFCGSFIALSFLRCPYGTHGVISDPLLRHEEQASTSTSNTKSAWSYCPDNNVKRSS